MTSQQTDLYTYMHLSCNSWLEWISVLLIYHKVLWWPRHLLFLKTDEQYGWECQVVIDCALGYGGLGSSLGEGMANLLYTIFKKLQLIWFELKSCDDHIFLGFFKLWFPVEINFFSFHLSHEGNLVSWLTYLPFSWWGYDTL